MPTCGGEELKDVLGDVILCAFLCLSSIQDCFCLVLMIETFSLVICS
jgi:hypothetical protein